MIFALAVFAAGFFFGYALGGRNRRKTTFRRTRGLILPGQTRRGPWWR